MTQYGTRAGRRIVDLPTIAIDGGGTGATTAAGAFDALKQPATESYTGVVELATTAEATTGTDTSRAVTAAGLTAFAQSFTQTWGHAPDVIVEAQHASGTNGGAGSAGSYATRPLNTLVRNHGTLASLASNQVTLPAGTYVFAWRAPAFFVGSHKSRLRNVTDSTTAGLGSTEYSPQASNGWTTATVGSAVVTIAGAKVFELQHYIQAAPPTPALAFGFAASFGDNEIYAHLQITKVA